MKANSLLNGTQSPLILTQKAVLATMLIEQKLTYLQTKLTK